MDKPKKITKRGPLAERYQSSEESAEAAKRRARQAQQEEEARSALHQEDRQRTSHRLKVWLHNGALSVEGASTFFLRGWDIGASEGRLRLLEPGSLLRLSFTNTTEHALVVLRLNHLSYGLEGGGHSPIAITLNKQGAAKEVNPPRDYYATERFDLSAFVKAGENALEITLGQATSPYWLESLELLY